jgi:hypothetical protein
MLPYSLLTVGCYEKCTVMTGYFIQKVSTRKKEVLTMNSQDIVIYIFIGIAIIGLVYFAWISRKKQDSSEEFKKHKNNQADL